MSAPGRIPWALAALAVTLLLAAPAGAAKKPAPVAVPSARDAERWLQSPPADARNRALDAFVKGAPLPDLVWLLRRPPELLGGLEPALVRAALERCPAERAELRRRLTLRLAIADPVRARKEMGSLVPYVAELPVRPRASAFRLGLLRPDTGSYAPYTRAVRAGVEAALDDANSVSLRPMDLAAWSTAGDSPEGAVGALDLASASAGVLVGELLSVPTIAAAAGARTLGLPLISPTATDESIGRLGPSVFQVGPSGARRGNRLAREILKGRGQRVGVLASTDVADGSFARGFAAAAESLGAEIAWRSTFTPGTPDFRAAIRALGGKRLEVLFLDGEVRDVRVFLTQLAKEQLPLQICGGESLDPEQHHPETRVLLEGVRWVPEDWEVPMGIQARLDSLALAIGEARGGSLFVRGYYSGRMVCAALHAGALAPEEVATWLRGRRDPLPDAAAAGFLDCMSEGARLPVFTVVRGKAVVAP